MTLSSEIAAILSDPRRGSENYGDFEDVEAIEALIPRYGWLSVRDAMLALLAADGRCEEDYHVAACVIWCAMDKHSVPADRTIALLYHRFDPRGDQENNLVWSITSKLRGVGYLSDYEPLKDPKVLVELEAIRNGS